MSPLNLILFCNQPYLKGDPLNSWVFDDIAETSYLQIILDRWIASERVNKIFLLADSLELTKKLEKHIDFIDKTYDGLKNPIEGVKRFLSR